MPRRILSEGVRNDAGGQRIPSHVHSPRVIDLSRVRHDCLLQRRSRQRGQRLELVVPRWREVSEAEVAKGGGGGEVGLGEEDYAGGVGGPLC